MEIHNDYLSKSSSKPMELTVGKITIVLLIVFAAMLTISVGIRMRREKVHIRPKDGGSEADVDPAFRAYFEHKREMNSLELFAVGIGFMASAILILMNHVWIGVTVAILIPAVTLLYTRTRR